MSSVPQSKDELLAAINSIFPKLVDDYRIVPESLSRKCEIEGNVKGTQISICDTVAYLVGWGKLVLKWHSLKSQGLPVDFPDTGYKWNQLGLLAVSFHDQYSDWKYEDLLKELDLTINELIYLVSSLDNEELYETAWYEKWTLGRMIQFNTSSPMKNMRTKVRRFNKNNELR
ncbi:DfsB family protein [Vibrio anguillarum]|uniref:ClbS/DfsB family four-helix bundle protein n=4 Tax=Vibrio TaxID=662 RepID=A0A9X4EZ07_9VIBR|nr:MULTISPECIES: ClbS/DfsB family four-helix bundle protein [Gammaproteobacteria]KAA1205799.1 ClbS/DfsB family four-helix bundle protein [Vibrio cholerae]KAA1252512.1 ClbS/DfsB family four-helix bundle protein [Vibrio cholerae]MBE0418681.1 ClbS/DfsB family four-helix bundle protein [Pseudoalteromonas nigrifaciens]MBF4247199.1 DfsB family protein [Vibrio anguillarum]MBF4375469.1 DfsB family protein [Vibrio anguillarum]